MQINAIDPAKTAMIVVDMQNDFVATGAPMETPAARAMVPKLAHVLRRDGCDMGLFDDMHPPIANREGLMDVMRQRVMQCSATTEWCSSRMRPRHMTIQIEVSHRCQMPMSTMPLWSYWLPRRHM
jgi:nicotinamidase-related amidase